MKAELEDWLFVQKDLYTDTQAKIIITAKIVKLVWRHE